MINFELTPYNFSDATTVQASYQTALNTLAYESKAVLFKMPVYSVFVVPTTLEAAYNAANDVKKNRMMEISKQVMSVSVAQDFNTAYLLIYNLEY